MSVVEIALAAVAAYLALGALVGLAFVTVGIGRVDEAARGSSIAFRALVLPGCVALWPVVIAKWARRRRPG